MYLHIKNRKNSSHHINSHHNVSYKVFNKNKTVVQMAVEATIGKKTFASTKSNHAEELLFSDSNNLEGDLVIEMNAWPCVGEGFHNCHKLFLTQSKGRIITVHITEDHAGYAADHGLEFGSTGTITYQDGASSISGKNAISNKEEKSNTEFLTAYNDPNTSKLSKSLISDSLNSGRYPPKR